MMNVFGGKQEDIDIWIRAFKEEVESFHKNKITASSFFWSTLEYKTYDWSGFDKFCVQKYDKNIQIFIKLHLF